MLLVLTLAEIEAPNRDEVLWLSTAVVMPAHSCAAQVIAPLVPTTDTAVLGEVTWPAKISHAGLNPVADGPATSLQLAPWPLTVTILWPKFSEQVTVTTSPSLVVVPNARFAEPPLAKVVCCTNEKGTPVGVGDGVVVTVGLMVGVRVGLRVGDGLIVVVTVGVGVPLIVGVGVAERVGVALIVVVGVALMVGVALGVAATTALNATIAAPPTRVPTQLSDAT